MLLLKSSTLQWKITLASAEGWNNQLKLVGTYMGIDWVGLLR